MLLKCWWKTSNRRKKKNNSDSNFRLLFFLTQENPDTFPILICRDSKHGETGATCSERKGPATCFISLLVGFTRIISKCDNQSSTNAFQGAVCVGGSDSRRGRRWKKSMAQFWRRSPSPPSFANTDPHLHTTLSRSVEHVDANVELVPWPFPDQQL